MRALFAAALSASIGFAVTCQQAEIDTYAEGAACVSLTDAEEACTCYDDENPGCDEINTKVEEAKNALNCVDSSPSTGPTLAPTLAPTLRPTAPTLSPTLRPTAAPVDPTPLPTSAPTVSPLWLATSPYDVLLRANGAALSEGAELSEEAEETLSEAFLPLKRVALVFFGWIGLYYLSQSLHHRGTLDAKVLQRQREELARAGHPLPPMYKQTKWASKMHAKIVEQAPAFLGSFFMQVFFIGNFDTAWRMGTAYLSFAVFEGLIRFRSGLPESNIWALSVMPRDVIIHFLVVSVLYPLYEYKMLSDWWVLAFFPAPLLWRYIAWMVRHEFTYETPLAEIIIAEDKNAPTMVLAAKAESKFMNRAPLQMEDQLSEGGIEERAEMERKARIEMASRAADLSDDEKAEAGDKPASTAAVGEQKITAPQDGGNV